MSLNNEAGMNIVLHMEEVRETARGQYVAALGLLPHRGQGAQKAAREIHWTI